MRVPLRGAPWYGVDEHAIEMPEEVNIVENAVFSIAHTAVENLYALAWRAGLLTVDGDDPLHRMFRAILGNTNMCASC